MAKKFTAHSWERDPREKKTKKCAHCKQIKKREEFYARAVALDGLQSYCKECKKLTEGIKRIQSLAEGPERRCSYCKQVKPASEFNKNAKDCKMCKKIMWIKYKYRRREQEEKTNSALLATQQALMQLKRTE